MLSICLREGRIRLPHFYVRGQEVIIPGRQEFFFLSTGSREMIAPQATKNPLFLLRVFYNHIIKMRMKL